MHTDNSVGSPSALGNGLMTLFMISGASALAYQVCWQRVLFFTFGTDIESITIVVSSFMLGLGIGALAGGRIADRFPNRILAVFAGFELGIAVFGFLSVPIMLWVGDALVLKGQALTALTIFLILLIPTTFMGATLPMLISYFFRFQKNIGVSTGQLYGVNTLGAALGTMIVGYLAFHYFTLTAVVHSAAYTNLIVACSGSVLYWRAR